MANQNSTVQVDIIADAKKFREELKKAASDANAFNKGMKDIKKAGGKQDKDLQRLAKEAGKFNKSAHKDAIDHEKKLLGLMKQRLSEMKKISNHNSADFKQKRKEAAEAAKLYSEMRFSRAGSNQGGGTLGRVGGMIGRGIIGGGALLAGTAIGALTARVGKAGDAATQMRAAGINLAGDSTITSRRDLMDLTKHGSEMGYDPQDTAQQAAAMARSTGLGAQVAHGQMFARSGMLDMGQATSFMGLQARGGAANNPAEQKRDLEKIMTLAFANGLEKGRFGEYLEGVASLVEGAQGRSAGNESGVGYAKALAQLDSTGHSGFRGARGAKVLSQLEQGFMSGGGAAGRALSLSAMGYGTPGGGTSYYDAMKGIQSGFSNPDNMNKMLGNLKYRYGGNMQAAAIAGSEQTGLSFDQMEKLLSMDTNSPELKKELEKIAEESVPLEQQMVDIMKGELAEQAKIQSQRQQLLVEEGDQIVDSLNDMQDATNRMIDKFWPVAVKSLEIIAKTLDVVADATTDAYDFWQSIDMFSTDKSDMSKGQLASEASEELVKDVQRQMKTGMLDEATGLSMLKADRDANRKLQADAEARKDYQESARFGMAADESSKAVTGIMNSHGSSYFDQQMMAAQAKQAEENRMFKEREESRRKQEADARAAERARIAALPQGKDAALLDATKEQTTVLKTMVERKAVDRTSPTLQRQ